MEILNLSLTDLIQTFGLIGLCAIVFAESGLFFGFFLPGDSLLFTAGILASQDFLNIYYLLPLLWISAVLGDTVGYWFGSVLGHKVFTKEDSFFFRKKHVEQTKIFYEKYGARAIVLARFVPIARTFVPILAGVAEMPYRTFLIYNCLGALLWSVGITLLGFFLGNSVPQIQEYLLPITLLIIAISLLPLLREWVKHRQSTLQK